MTRPVFRYSPENPSHFLGIDAMRGVAALCVVVFHYHHFYLADAFGREALPPTTSFPYASVLNPLFVNGHYAVQVFWVMSGFVFSHVYLRRPTDFRHFWGARFARLYPLHFATLMLVAVVELASLKIAGHVQIYGNFDLKQFGLQLFMASNWVSWSRGLSFNGPIWSVSLEIFAYAVFFVTLPVLRRWQLPTALLICVAGYFIGSRAGLHILVIQHASFTTTGYFFTGVLLYIAVRRFNFDQRFSGSLLLILALLYFAAAGLHPESQARVVLAATAVVLFGVACEALPLRRLPVLQWLGDISYSLYLVHVPIQMIVLTTADIAFGHTRAFANSYITLPLFLVTVLTVASLAHYRFERPAGRYLRARVAGTGHSTKDPAEAG